MTGGQRELRALLENAGVRPSKRLGQNFLVDSNLMRVMVEEAALSAEDVVLEIGCATGRLTELLAEGAGAVYGVEVEPRLAELARQRLTEFRNVVIDTCDIMESKSELNPKVIAKLRSMLAGRKETHLKVVSNLPYSVGSLVLGALLLGELPIELMVLTLQEEVAERITARPGSKEYGTLSVLSQVFSEVRPVRSVPPTAFWPKPEVSSTILRFVIRKEARDEVRDVEKLVAVLRAVFGYRRKKLGSALRHVTKEANKETVKGLLEGAGVDADRRGESLSPKEIVKLANMLAEDAASRGSSR